MTFIHATRVSLAVILTSSLLVACRTTRPPTRPTPPEADRQFLRLPSGVSLNHLQVDGQALALAVGTGQSFAGAEFSAFGALKAATQTEEKHPVQWALMDLDQHRLVARSLAAGRPVFGASLSKLYVAGTLLDKQKGRLTDAQLQLMAEMLVVSSNPAWTALQTEIGDGDPDRGRAANYAFTQRLGYARTRGYQGTWGSLHGNELTCLELIEYLFDLYQGHFRGAEIQWKIMHTERTGLDRARKYLPSSQLLGSKTGTYDGPTLDPETQSATTPAGVPYEVHVRHQVLVFNKNGHEYVLVVLSNSGNDEDAALLAGGLYQEL